MSRRKESLCCGGAGRGANAGGSADAGSAAEEESEDDLAFPFFLEILDGMFR